MEELISSGIITPDGQIVVLEGWIGAAIAGLAAIASSIIASSSSKKQTNKTAAANMQLAEYQAEKNEALIDKQNAYNAPKAQMGRFSEAGLNPNLIYSQGNPGNQASPARYDAPTVDYHFTPFQIPEVLGMYQDFEMKQAQIENINASTDNVNERTINESLRHELMSLAGKKGALDLETKSILAPYQRAIGKIQYQKAGLDVQKLMNSFQQQNLNIKQTELRNENLRMQNTFQRYEEQFRKMGITSSDHILVRVLTRMLNKAGIDVMDYLKP